MIGMWLVRSRCLISSAVSKPSSSGICTSRRMQAKSWSSSSLSAASPDPTETRFWPSGSRIASSASRFFDLSSTSRMLAWLLLTHGTPHWGNLPVPPDPFPRFACANRPLRGRVCDVAAETVEEEPHLLDPQHGVCVDRGDRRLGHPSPLGRLRILDDRDAAALLDLREARGPVVV